MKFSLFRKPKQQTEPENPTVPPQEAPTEKTTVAPEEPKQEETAPQNPAPKQETVPPPQPQKQEPIETPNKTYLKALPLKELSDLENIKNEVKNGNIVILRVTPLATKSIEEVKSAVNELYEFTESVGGDIARLGEERVVICPKNIKIWREKMSATSEPLSTAA